MKLFEGKVYMITSKETEKIYIGSTTQKLRERFGKHKSNNKRGFGGSANKIVKYPDADIYLLDRMYVTKSKSDPELFNLEGKYQLINKDICVNKFISRGMTDKERSRLRYTDPALREKCLKRSKKYDLAHKKNKKRYDHFRNSFFGKLCKLYNN